jgi:peptidoglycan/LPS O-acetylase OafA/YrhL
MKITNGNVRINESSPNKIGYIPALDGLRAIAVFLVMLLHAHFHLGKGGSIGVDIFFCLSGFLITTLLLEEYKNHGSISLSGFYIRRTFRLFPALYFMLFIILLYTIFFATSFSKIILNEIFASAIYMYNLSYLWECKSLLLGHTWSLAVEEQFYFFWPFILVIVLRYLNINKLLYGLLFFIVIIWFVKLSKISPIINALVFESLFIGCLFALLRWKIKTLRISSVITNSAFLLLVIVGIFPLTIPVTLFNNDFRGVFGIISALLILGLVQNKDSILSTILGSSFFVYFGKISYALYLWHVPVFKWFGLHSTFPPHIRFVLKFIVTFILAVVSLELIEKKSIKIGRKLSDRYTKNE